MVESRFTKFLITFSVCMITVAANLQKIVEEPQSNRSVTFKLVFISSSSMLDHLTFFAYQQPFQTSFHIPGVMRIIKYGGLCSVSAPQAPG